MRVSTYIPPIGTPASADRTTDYSRETTSFLNLHGIIPPFAARLIQELDDRGVKTTFTIYMKNWTFGYPQIVEWTVTRQVACITPPCPRHNG